MSNKSRAKGDKRRDRLSSPHIPGAPSSTVAPQATAKKIESNKEIKTGGAVLDIPLAQLLPDPNQPRERFNEERLKELASSIEDQGLQQEAKVNFAFKKDGLSYYYLKAGERRMRAHKLLGKSTMRCVVEEVTYTGKFDVKRRLAQAAENSSREPHTHSEIIKVTREVVEETLKELNNRHGAIEVALQTVSRAFGKSKAWAQNYHTLGGLLPELQVMMDENESGEKLNFSVAMALARCPKEEQLAKLKEAQPIFEKSGHAAGYAFLVRTIREFREKSGEKMRGKASDEKTQFIKFGQRLLKLMEEFSGGRKNSEHKVYVENMLARMTTSEVDELLGNLGVAIEGFLQFKEAVKKKREVNYRELKVVK